MRLAAFVALGPVATDDRSKSVTTGAGNGQLELGHGLARRRRPLYPLDAPEMIAISNAVQADVAASPATSRR